MPTHFLWVFFLIYYIMEIILGKEITRNSNDLPIGTYFTCPDNKNQVFLKIYGGKYIDITNGEKTYSSCIIFENCTVLVNIKLVY